MNDDCGWVEEDGGGYATGDCSLGNFPDNITEMEKEINRLRKRGQWNTRKIIKLKEITSFLVEPKADDTYTGDSLSKGVTPNGLRAHVDWRFLYGNAPMNPSDKSTWIQPVVNAQCANTCDTTSTFNCIDMYRCIQLGQKYDVTLSYTFLYTYTNLSSANGNRITLLQALSLLINYGGVIDQVNSRKYSKVLKLKNGSKGATDNKWTNPDNPSYCAYNRDKMCSMVCGKKIDGTPRPPKGTGKCEMTCSGGGWGRNCPSKDTCSGELMYLIPDIRTLYKLNHPDSKEDASTELISDWNRNNGVLRGFARVHLHKYSENIRTGLISSATDNKYSEHAILMHYIDKIGPVSYCTKMSRSAEYMKGDIKRYAKKLKKIKKTDYIYTDSLIEEHPDLLNSKCETCYENNNCPSSGHCMTIVGYRFIPNDVKSSYWIVMNQWGGEWSDKGFFYPRMFPCEGNYDTLDRMHNIVAPIVYFNSTGLPAMKGGTIEVREDMRIFTDEADRVTSDFSCITAKENSSFERCAVSSGCKCNADYNRCPKIGTWDKIVQCPIGYTCTGYEMNDRSGKMGECILVDRDQEDLWNRIQDFLQKVPLYVYVLVGVAILVVLVILAIR